MAEESQVKAETDRIHDKIFVFPVHLEIASDPGTASRGKRRAEVSCQMDVTKDEIHGIMVNESVVGVRPVLDADNRTPIQV